MCDWALLTWAFVTPFGYTWLWLVNKMLMARPLNLCCGLRVKMLIYQWLRYSVSFLIDGTSNGYTLITIHEIKPWVFFKLSCDSIAQGTLTGHVATYFLWRKFNRWKEHLEKWIFISGVWYVTFAYPITGLPKCYVFSIFFSKLW